jgi:positive regulator of sigma E activity
MVIAEIQGNIIGIVQVFKEATATITNVSILRGCHEGAKDLAQVGNGSETAIDAGMNQVLTKGQKVEFNRSSQ